MFYTVCAWDGSDATHGLRASEAEMLVSSLVNYIVIEDDTWRRWQSPGAK